nr:MAG TPA: hypothetical protein [Crassvirales sp.]
MFFHDKFNFLICFEANIAKRLESKIRQSAKIGGFF